MPRDLGLLRFERPGKNETETRADRGSMTRSGKEALSRRTPDRRAKPNAPLDSWSRGLNEPASRSAGP